MYIEIEYNLNYYDCFEFFKSLKKTFFLENLSKKIPTLTSGKCSRFVLFYIASYVNNKKYSASYIIILHSKLWILRTWFKIASYIIIFQQQAMYFDLFCSTPHHPNNFMGVIIIVLRSPIQKYPNNRSKYFLALLVFLC